MYVTIFLRKSPTGLDTKVIFLLLVCLFALDCSFWQVGFAGHLLLGLELRLLFVIDNDEDDTDDDVVGGRSLT